MKGSLDKIKIATALLTLCLVSGTAALTIPETRSATPLNTKTNPQDGQVYVWIPPGSFMMGCSADDEQCFNDEKPAHQVTISQGFWIGQTEVTVRAYEKFAGVEGGSNKTASGDIPAGNTTAEQLMPAVNITWDEATRFCTWAGGRLPTEAQWEYAARAGSSTARYNDVDEIAWYDKNSNNTVHQAAQKRANALGLFDMLGNAWEWVSDFYDGQYYSKSPSSDPAGPDAGHLHGLRGGSWLSNSKLVRVSDRGRSTAELRFNYFGLRCVLSDKIRP
jgi:formylglycine-generating enzyme required for sulfatase activity